MADRDRPILFALFGLNRAGQILYGTLIVVVVSVFFGRQSLLPRLRFSEQDEQLFRAARHGDRAGVEQALSAGASLDHAAPVDLKTALFRAAVFGHADLVRLMIDRGADPAVVGADGQSVMDIVLQASREEKDPAARRNLDAVVAVLEEKAR